MMKQNLKPLTVTLSDSPYNHQPWYSAKSFEALSSLSHLTDDRNPIRTFCDRKPDSQRKNMLDNNRDMDNLCMETILEDILREFSGFVLLHRQMNCPESSVASDSSVSEDDADPDGVNDNDGLDRKARPPNI